VHMFDIVMQYRAIFSGDGGAGGAAVAGGGGGFSGAGILSDWAAVAVGRYMGVVRARLAEISEGAQLASVLEHCMYCGMSLSRVGCDFRGLLVPFFEVRAAEIFLQGVAEALSSFSQMVHAHQWAAAPALCAALGEWGRTLVEGRAVLELGCGCGVCAVFCAAELGAARVVATDSSAAALDCLRETLEGLCTPSVATRVETRFLEWGDCAPTTSAASGAGSDAAATAAASAGRQGAHLALSAEDLFPFIVGSDLLYEPAAAKSLPWAVKRHLAPGGRALLCLKNRSSRNLAAFEANALSAGLRLGHRRAAEAPEAAALERRALSGASPSARESSDGGHVLVALELAGEPNSPWERVSCDAPGFEWREVGRLAGT